MEKKLFNVIDFPILQEKIFLIKKFVESIHKNLPKLIKRNMELLTPNYLSI
jgi:hypothetical protein